jgi:phosphatidate cytidylyltransferase
MHFKRWITSLVALPILIFLIYQGGVLFSLTIVVASFIGMWEYFQIVWQKDARPLTQTLSVSGIVLGTLVILSVHLHLYPLMFFIFSLAIILPAFFSIKQFQAGADIPRFLAFHALGVVYIPLSLALMIAIRNTEMGRVWIYLIICVVFAGDTGAYYAGTYFGKKKLCPNVSPGKTVIGAFGGLGANLVVGFVVQRFWMPEVHWAKIALFVIAIGIAGQVGDLFESMLKRSANVKDSGNLLPGHGGVLDRIDALLFAAPVAYVMMVYVVK